MKFRILALLIFCLASFSQLLSFPLVKDPFIIDSHSIEVLKYNFPEAFNSKFQGPFRLYLFADDAKISLAIKNEEVNTFHSYDPDSDSQIKTFIHPNVNSLAFPITGKRSAFFASFLANDSEKLALVEKDGQYSVIPFNVLKIKKNKWASFLSKYFSKTLPDIF